MSAAERPGHRWWRIDAAGVVLCLLITAVAYQAGYRPIVQRETRRLAQQQQVRQKEAELEQATLLLTALRDQLDTTRRAVRASRIRLHTTDQLNLRLGQIAEMASASGLEVEGIQPGRVDHGQRYETVPIRLSGVGRYGDCAVFLHRLHHVFPDTAVSSFELSGEPEVPDRPAAFRFTLTWFASPSADPSRGAPGQSFRGRAGL